MKVYFQPPADVRLEFPCIVFKLEGGDTKYADDGPYKYRDRYTVTAITTNPDSRIREYIRNGFRLCRYDRRLVNKNLIHDIFTIYY